jgi:hypothetical protein
MEMRKKYLKLNVEDTFPDAEMTPSEVEFIELCLDKLKVDLESNFRMKYVLSKKQVIFLLLGIMREYAVFHNNKIN